MSAESRRPPTSDKSWDVNIDLDEEEDLDEPKSIYPRVYSLLRVLVLGCFLLPGKIIMKKKNALYHRAFPLWAVSPGAGSWGKAGVACAANVTW